MVKQNEQQQKFLKRNVKTKWTTTKQPKNI